MRRIGMGLLALALLAPLCGCVIYHGRPEGRDDRAPDHGDRPDSRPGHWG